MDNIFGDFRRMHASVEERQIRLRCLEVACHLLPEDCSSADVEDVLANADMMVEYVMHGYVTDKEDNATLSKLFDSIDDTKDSSV